MWGRSCCEYFISTSLVAQISSHNALLQGPSKACRYNYLQGPNKEPVVSYHFCRVLSKRAFRNDYWREVVRRMGQALVKARWKVAFMKPLPFPIFFDFLACESLHSIKDSLQIFDRRFSLLNMNFRWSIFLMSAYYGFSLCEIVCLPRNMDPAKRPDKESCEHIVNLLQDWVEQFGPRSVQTYAPPHAALKPGQYETPRLIVDTRRSTQRTGRLCAVKIEVLVGKKPATITRGELANTMSNIVTECLVRQRTLGWKRGGSGNRIKIWLDSYTNDNYQGQCLPLNETGPFFGIRNETIEGIGSIRLPSEGQTS